MMKKENRMIWFVSCVIFILTCLYFTTARECLDRAQPNTLCRITTPAGYDCSNTYDIINISNGKAITAKGFLEALNSSLGLCYLNFTKEPGDYKIVLNEDNTSRVIVVDSNTLDAVKNVTNYIEGDTRILQTNLSDIKNITNYIEADSRVLETNLTSIRNDISEVQTNTSNLLINVSSILRRLGDPTTNSTSIWQWLYIPDSNSCTDADFSGIAKLWCFVWRTIHAIEP